jgi:hypothetical protein
VAESLVSRRAVRARAQSIAVGDDRPQPRAEPAPAIEPVEPPDRGQERLLRDVLGGALRRHRQGFTWTEHDRCASSPLRI